MPTVSMPPTGDAPTGITLPSSTPTGGAPVGIAQPNRTPTGGAPVAQSVGEVTPIDGAPMPVAGGEPTPQITMPASFTPAFVELTGGGLALNALNAVSADVGKVLQGTVGGQLKSYQVRAGTEATDSPGIIRCANFHADTNALVFVQL